MSALRKVRATMYIDLLSFSLEGGGLSVSKWSVAYESEFFCCLRAVQDSLAEEPFFGVL